MFVETKLKTFIFAQMRPFKWHACTFIAIALLWALELSFAPYLIKVILDRMTITPPAELVHAIGWIIALYLAISLTMSIFYRVWQITRRAMIPRLKANITETLSQRLLEQSYTFYQNHFAGSLSNKVNDVVQGIPQLVDIVFDAFIANALGLIVAACVLATVRFDVALIFCVWVTLFLVGSWHFAKQAHLLSDAFSEKRSALTGRLVDILGNMNVVRLFSAKLFERKNIQTWAREVMHTEREFDWVLVKMFAFQSLSFFAMETIILVYLMFARAHSEITIGDFVLVMTINAYIVNNLWSIGQQFNTFSEQLGKVGQGLRLTMDIPTLQDLPQAADLTVQAGRLNFKQISFQYLPDRPLFEALSVQIPAGRKVGLVGHSGSGKTTFVNLILRLFDLQKGEILIDGQNIKAVTQESLRQAISFIPQDPTLFHRSILENIRYGCRDASQEEVIAAAKQAHAHEFIEVLPEGYGSLVGERGIKLSGGQRQRIAIARAILKNAPILILDEATSALDSITEHCIQDSLATLMQGRTTLVVAHRLSTLLTMDDIMVFDQGRIAEQGTHSALLAQGGLYKALWDAQVGGFIAD